MSTDTAELATDTLAVLEAKGWNHYGAFGTEGQVCLSVATIMVPAAGKLRRAIRERIGRGTIGEWNDHPKRTYEDVVGLLKAIRDEGEERKQ